MSSIAQNDRPCVNAHVADARARQVELQRLPPRAVVERHVDAGFRPRVQQSAPNGILPDAPRVGARRDASVDRGPCLTVVRRPPEIRLEVVLLITVGRQIGRARIEMPGLDHGRPRELPEALRRDVRPVRAAIARDVHHPIVTARPEHAFREGRLGEGVDRRIPLGARHVTVNRSAGPA